MKDSSPKPMYYFCYCMCSALESISIHKVREATQIMTSCTRTEARKNQCTKGDESCLPSYMSLDVRSNGCWSHFWPGYPWGYVYIYRHLIPGNDHKPCGLVANALGCNHQLHNVKRSIKRTSGEISTLFISASMIYSRPSSACSHVLDSHSNA